MTSKIVRSLQPISFDPGLAEFRAQECFASVHPPSSASAEPGPEMKKQTLYKRCLAQNGCDTRILAVLMVHRYTHQRMGPYLR